MIECEAVEELAAMRIQGFAPDGTVSIDRRWGSELPTDIRFGAFVNDLGGFTVDDTEAPVGVPVTYRTHLSLLSRTIQRNLVLTPRFTHGVQSWVPGSSRVITIDGAGYGKITGNPAGTGSGLPGRTIADVAIAPLNNAETYLVTGQVRIHTPDLWTWDEVRTQGTWTTLKANFANWEAVRQTEAGLIPGSVFTTLWGGLVTGTTVHVGPFKLIDVPMGRNNEWFTFAAYVTTPNPIPATARLRIYHGTILREYTINWDLDRVQVKSVTDGSTDLGRLFYMDGDTPKPTRPQDNLLPDGTWEDESGDASINWTGTVGNSASVYSSPSKIYSQSTCQIDPPDTAPITVDGVPCDPIIFSDPINARLGLWVGLMELPGNTFSSRSGSGSVFDRADPLPATQIRSWESGELVVLTKTIEQRTMFTTVMGSGRVVLLRNPDPAYPENNWYLLIGDIDEARIEGDARRPERLWSVPYVRVAKPVGTITSASVNNWNEVQTNFSWQELANTRTWLGALINPVDA